MQRLQVVNGHIGETDCVAGALPGPPASPHQLHKVQDDRKQACFLPRSSKWTRFAEKFHPDTVDVEAAVLLLLAILLPAVLLTLLLRACGIRGQGPALI